MGGYTSKHFSRVLLALFGRGMILKIGANQGTGKNLGISVQIERVCEGGSGYYDVHKAETSMDSFNKEMSFTRMKTAEIRSESQCTSNLTQSILLL